MSYLKRAANIFFTIQFTDVDDETPLPITGATVRFMVKRQLTDPDNAALINITNNALTINGAQGTASGAITAAQAEQLPANVPLFCEGMAVLQNGVVARTKTQGFTLQANLIKAIA